MPQSTFFLRVLHIFLRTGERDNKSKSGGGSVASQPVASHTVASQTAGERDNRSKYGGWSVASQTGVAPQIDIDHSRQSRSTPTSPMAMWNKSNGHMNIGNVNIIWIYFRIYIPILVKTNTKTVGIQ